MMITAWFLAAGLSLQSAPPARPDTPSEAPSTASAALADAYVLFLQARTLERDGDVTGAIAAYRRAVELALTAAAIRVDLAMLYAREGRATEAMAEARATLQIEPGNIDAHRTLGLVQSALIEQLVLDRRGPFVAEAVGHLERVVAGEEDPLVELTLADLYVKSEQPAKAVTRMRAFLARRPGDLDALMVLADAHDAAGRASEAMAVLEEASRTSPSSAAPRTRLAEIYERGGQWKRAAAVWGDLQHGNPRVGVYRMRHATALAAAGDLTGGLAELYALTRDRPQDASVWFLLSQVELRAGHPAEAEQAAIRVRAIDARDARGLVAFAEARAARRDYRAVVEALDARVAEAAAEDLVDGTYPRMARTLGSALVELADRTRAVAVLEAAVARAGADADLRFVLAAAYERDNRVDRAERTFREVLAIDPLHAEALNYLGFMLADRGLKLQEAVALVQRAVILDASNASYKDSLGWAYFKLGRFELARPPLEQAAAALPRTSLIQDHLGDLYAQLRRFRDAADAWDRALSGDRQGIDAASIARKRDRARQQAGGSD